jgi:hypothetical protein
MLLFFFMQDTIWAHYGGSVIAADVAVFGVLVGDE